jgi:hypothetical protein
MATAKPKKETAENTPLSPQEDTQIVLDGLSEKERLEWLDLHAHAVKEEEYRAPLSDEELDEVKDRVTRYAIEMQVLEDEKKAFMDEWKERMKPISEANEEVVREARSKERVGFGKVWYVVNTEAKTTLKVTEGNLIISSRASLKEELAARLFVS